jgi:hypothetical protein
MSALDKQEGGSHYKDMAIQPIELLLELEYTDQSGSKEPGV